MWTTGEERNDHDHHSNREPDKIQAWTTLRVRVKCSNQLSYQANWEPVICELLLSIKSYVNMWNNYVDELWMK